MKKQPRSILLLLYTLILLCMGCVLSLFIIPEDNRMMIAREIWVDVINGGNPQENPVSKPPGELLYYQIDPATILTDLRKGKNDVFHLFENEPDRTPEPSGTYVWTQEEYLMVAKAHHLYLTGELVENSWKIFGSGDFVISQCRDNMKGFDRAHIIFYKEEPEFFRVTYMVIRPLTGWIESAYLEYDRRPLARGFYEASVMNGSITADEALQIAEEMTGKSMRQELSNNNCYVRVSFFGDNEWDVGYSWENDDLDVYINANDGSYRALRR